MLRQYPLSIEITQIVSNYASSLRFNELDSSTLHAVGLFLIDYVASVYAGYRVNSQFNSALNLVLQGEITSSGKSTIYFCDVKAPSASAAFLNAAYAHGADIDDGNKGAMGHIGAHLISALGSLAEESCCSFKTFVESVVVGYDIFCRLGSAVQPGLVNRGYHSTGMVGAIACAAASAKLLGLRSDGIYHSIAIAASQASGLLLVGETGQETKPLNAARAAQIGVFSAKLAANGVVGPACPLESNKGWCHEVSDLVDEHAILDGLGKRFSINECYLKKYPSCRHTHCAIEAAEQIRKKAPSKEITGVSIWTYGHAIELAGQIDMPRSSSEAKFSIKYAVATVLNKGAFGFQALEVGSVNSEVIKLISRIDLLQDDTLERISEGVRGARVSVRFRDGSELLEEVLIPKGDPENPFNDGDILRKLSDCASWKYDSHDLRARSQGLFDRVNCLLKMPDVEFSFLDM